MAPFRELWPWHPRFLRPFGVVFSAGGVVLALATYPLFGPMSLWFLTGLFIGGMVSLIYGAVGAKVRALHQEYAEDPGEVVESLLVIGGLQSPGLAILRDQELVLAPIVGHAVTLPKADIEVLREGRMLPGKYVWGKRAFILEPVDGKRLAFAVAESIGARWSTVLSSKGTGG